VLSVISAAIIGLVAAILLTRGKASPDNAISADSSNVFGHPGLATTQPVPTGRPAGQAQEFRRDPCAVVTAEELGAAVAQPFHNVSGKFPRRDRVPAAKGAGCVYGFVADASDPAEVYHKLEVTVAQATAEGAKSLSDCLAATPRIPYGPIEAGDQACLGAGSTAVFRLGANHFTVKVAATPPRADRKDEEAELAPLVKVAAKLFAGRLPAAG
jgi:hypothetical protein